jgi:hypothetical protein
MPQCSRPSTYFPLVLALGLALQVQACSSSTSPGPGDSGPTDSSTNDGGPDGTPSTDGGDASSNDAQVPCEDCCEENDDCVWAEINREITQQSDCMCLLGCAGLKQNRTTRDRRQAQYDAYCYWGQDGQGNPCPVDECIEPPTLACVDGHCDVPDGGM